MSSPQGARAARPVSISIVLPVYNNTRTLDRTLESILCLEGLERADLVVSDDASTDGTPALVKEWASEHGQKFHRFALIENSANLGIAGNHQAAFDAVETTHAVYLGGDDIVCDPSLIGNLETAIAERGIVIAKLRLETLTLPGGRVDDLYGPMRAFFRMGAARQFSALAAFGNFLYAGPGTVLSMAAFRSLGRLDPRFRSFEDYPLFMLFLVNGYRFELLPFGGIQWVRSEHSLSASGFAGMKPQFLSDLRLLSDMFILPNRRLFRFPYGLAWRLREHPMATRVLAKICRTLRGFPR